jgi:hypothetical protein
MLKFENSGCAAGGNGLVAPELRQPEDGYIRSRAPLTAKFVSLTSGRHAIASPAFRFRTWLEGADLYLFSHG